MKATSDRVALLTAALLLLLLLSLALGLCTGTAAISPAQIWDWLTGASVDPTQAVIISHLRLPRLLLAACVGASLSLGGAVFQGVLRNPLAEPFILGVSGGGALGAVLGFLLGLQAQWSLAGLAFCGSIITVFLVLGVSQRHGRLESATLILTGVMINAFCSAVIMFVISTTTDQKLYAILFWLYGDLGNARMAHLLLLAPITLAGGAILFFFSRHLNLLSAGERAAASAGVSVERVKAILFFTVSVMCGATVSLSGLIGFVGLMVPHLVRITCGHDHRVLIPASGLLGAALLVLADTCARTIISPSQLPVGVVTAFLGAPFFLLLLAGKGSQWQ